MRVYSKQRLTKFKGHSRSDNVAQLRLRLPYLFVSHLGPTDSAAPTTATDYQAERGSTTGAGLAITPTQGNLTQRSDFSTDSGMSAGLCREHDYLVTRLSDRNSSKGSVPHGQSLPNNNPVHSRSLESLRRKDEQFLSAEVDLPTCLLLFCPQALSLACCRNRARLRCICRNERSRVSKC